MANGQKHNIYLYIFAVKQKFRIYVLKITLLNKTTFLKLKGKRKPLPFAFFGIKHYMFEFHHTNLPVNAGL